MSALCPHGMPLADNVCGPCSKGKPMRRDLFGDEVPPPSKAARKSPKPWGYAAPPGTGPAGETCGTCEHHVVKRMAKDYHKCRLAKHLWTCGTRSDIRVRSPACSMWAALPGGDV